MLTLDRLPGYQPQPPLLGWVYALLDPRNSEVRYVGASLNVRSRVSQHFTRKGASSIGMRDWLKDLEGKRPVAVLLELVDVRELAEAELRWIQRCLDNGARLVNGRTHPTKRSYPWVCDFLHVSESPQHSSHD